MHRQISQQTLIVENELHPTVSTCTSAVKEGRNPRPSRGQDFRMMACLAFVVSLATRRNGQRLFQFFGRNGEVGGWQHETRLCAGLCFVALLRLGKFCPTLRRFHCSCGRGNRAGESQAHACDTHVLQLHLISKMLNGAVQVVGGASPASDTCRATASWSPWRGS